MAAYFHTGLGIAPMLPPGATTRPSTHEPSLSSRLRSISKLAADAKRFHATAGVRANRDRNSVNALAALPMRSGQ